MTRDLIAFHNKDFWNLIYTRHADRGGVYKVIAMRNNAPIHIGRFLNVDENGVLYIGKAISFINWVANLKKSISPDYIGSAHDCGVRYKSLEIPNIAKMYPYDILHIELFPDENPTLLESKMLLEYKMIFGEVPPLNAVG